MRCDKSKEVKIKNIEAVVMILTIFDLF